MQDTNDKPPLHNPSKWDSRTGLYVPPRLTWQIDVVEIVGRDDAPDVWLSKPDGEHRLAASFHFPEFNFPSGHGRLQNGIAYTPSPFLLHHVQDPYNSWNVKASSMRGKWLNGALGLAARNHVGR
jgi:hypothetical protein